MSAEALIVRLKRERNEAAATIERLTRELASHTDSFELAKRVLVNENKNLRSRLAEAERDRDEAREALREIATLVPRLSLIGRIASAALAGEKL